MVGIRYWSLASIHRKSPVDKKWICIHERSLPFRTSASSWMATQWTKHGEMLYFDEKIKNRELTCIFKQHIHCLMFYDQSFTLKNNSWYITVIWLVVAFQFVIYTENELGHLPLARNGPVKQSDIWDENKKSICRHKCPKPRQLEVVLYLDRFSMAFCNTEECLWK